MCGKCNLALFEVYALREEGDVILPKAKSQLNQFQSTPSARRATIKTDTSAIKTDVISIHALREEGDGKQVRIPRRAFVFQSTPSARRATPRCDCVQLAAKISIHALREEGDLPPPEQ